jgi:hypothetical protein
MSITGWIAAAAATDAVLLLRRRRGSAGACCASRLLSTTASALLRFLDRGCLSPAARRWRPLCTGNGLPLAAAAATAAAAAAGGEATVWSVSCESGAVSASTAACRRLDLMVAAF